MAQGIALALRRAWLDCGVLLDDPVNEAALLTGSDAGALARQLFPAPLEIKQRKADGASYAKTVREHLSQLKGLPPLALEK